MVRAERTRKFASANRSTKFRSILYLRKSSSVFSGGTLKAMTSTSPTAPARPKIASRMLDLPPPGGRTTQRQNCRRQRGDSEKSLGPPRAELESSQRSKCNCVHMGNETIHVVMKVAARIDDKGVEKRKIPEALGEFFGLWHNRAADQDWNERKADLQRGFYFDPDRVVGGGDPQLTILARPKPSRPHDREQNLRAQQGLTDVLPEINSGWNVFNVPEYRVLPIVAAEAGRECVRLCRSYHRGDRRLRCLPSLLLQIEGVCPGCTAAAARHISRARRFSKHALGSGKPDPMVSRRAAMT